MATKKDTQNDMVVHPQEAPFRRTLKAPKNGVYSIEYWQQLAAENEAERQDSQRRQDEQTARRAGKG